MLLSTVFALRPRANGALPLTQGHAIHAWFLHLVRQHAPQLADWLHSQERRKPFTTSPVQGALTRQGASALVQADQTYWLRVTSLDADLSACLLAIEAEPPPTVRLFEVEFAVQTVTSRSQVHPWAQRSHYEHLYAQAWDDSPASQYTLDFVSPTVFRSQGRNVLMPSPRLVFSSLWESWQAFAPLPLSAVLLPVLSTEIDVLRYELKTQMYDFGNYRQAGFVGSCTFGAAHHLSADVVRGLRLLLDTAFFTGVGYKTTMGMGQARHLERPRAPAPRATGTESAAATNYA